jgi:hypothetical protein
MKLLTKAWKYLQDLPFYSGKNRGDTRDTVGISINRVPKNGRQVYTAKTGVYNWEREEAVLRHPSNYKRRKK